MIAIKGLATLAVAGVVAIALAPRGAADPGQETFSLEFRYDASRPAVENYLAFIKQAERACASPGMRALDLRRHEQACMEDVMDQLVAAMGRRELAAIHDLRTGRPDDSSGMVAMR